MARCAMNHDLPDYLVKLHRQTGTPLPPVFHDSPMDVWHRDTREQRWSIDFLKFAHFGAILAAGLWGWKPFLVMCAAVTISERMKWIDGMRARLDATRPSQAVPLSMDDRRIFDAWMLEHGREPACQFIAYAFDNLTYVTVGDAIARVNKGIRDGKWPAA